MDWPGNRVQQLTQLIRAAAGKSVVRFTYLPNGDGDAIDYFPRDIADDASAVLGASVQYVPPAQLSADAVDVVIVTEHGRDLTHALWTLRQRLRSTTMICVWLWDNHLSEVSNIRTAAAADLVFFSHHYNSDYLAGPASVFAGHVPACCAQWTCAQAAALFAQHERADRRDALLVNYVDYPFSPRSQVLRNLKSDMPAGEADVLLMDPSDRTRYFAKSRDERFREWMRYKSTLILPLDRDLSTRVFDALLAGLVLLVPPNVLEFDAVIPPPLHEQLGIIKLADSEVSTIRTAAREGVATFDARGIAGARARHEYVLNHHMMMHRFAAMIGVCRQIAAGTFVIGFAGNAQTPWGLYLMRPPPG